MDLENWRFDGWAVRDGAAFVSRREPDSIKARGTVFLCVPDLEPVPVGRYSTALSSTRHNFQDGFRNEEGVEIPFEDLGQVRDVVRRGFLGTGLGPNGPGAPRSPGGPISGGEGPYQPGSEGGESREDGGAGPYYDSGVSMIEAATATWISEEQSPQNELRILAAGFQGTGSTTSLNLDWPETRLLMLVRRFAAATLLYWERRITVYRDPVDRWRLQAWYHLLYSIGIWPTEQEYAAFVFDHDLAEGRRVLERYHPFFLAPTPWPSWAQPGFGGRLLAELLAAAPCPLRPTWHHGFTRLAEKALMPMCTSDYYTFNPHLPELAPGVLASLVYTAPSIPGGDSLNDDLLIRRVGLGLRWLADQLPAVTLPLAADDELNRYAWGQLDF